MVKNGFVLYWRRMENKLINKKEEYKGREVEGEEEEKGGGRITKSWISFILTPNA